MTSPAEIIQKCAICGTENSTYCNLDFLDFDGDFTEDFEGKPKNWSSFGRVYCCKNCNYCSCDLTKTSPINKNFINSEQYKNLLLIRQFPDKALIFLADSLILEENKVFYKSATSALYAAWHCDWKGCYVQAKKCRVRAIYLLELYYKFNKIEENQLSEIKMLLVELCRRSEQFEKAIKYYRELKNEKLSGVKIKILVFQKILIDSWDINNFYFVDAEEYFNEHSTKEFYLKEYESFTERVEQINLVEDEEDGSSEFVVKNNNFDGFNEFDNYIEEDYAYNPLDGSYHDADWISDVFGMGTEDDIPWGNID